MRIKKLIAILMTTLIAFCMAACSGSGKADKQAKDVSELKVMGDAFAIGGTDQPYGYDEDHFIYIFDYNGAMTRVVTDLTEDVYAEMEAVDFFADDRDDQLFEILSELEITQVVDLSKDIPTQEELDKLIGKTGQELLDEGYEYSGAYTSPDDTEFYLVKGPYEFTAAFNEIVEMTDDLEGEEVLKDLTVKSVEYTGISTHATDFEY